jgi:twitching motility protein PilI
MARRISLREFQQDLVRRLTEARVSTETPTARLGVQVGTEYWLVRLDEAAEVMPPPPIVSVPLTRPWFRGLTNIRGNLYSVIDLAQFQGGAETLTTPDCRLLLVGEKYQMAAALLVGRMLGLRNLAAFERSDAPPQRPWEQAHYVDKDGRQWRELAMEPLVYGGDFLQAGT